MSDKETDFDFSMRMAAEVRQGWSPRLADADRLTSIARSVALRQMSSCYQPLSFISRPMPQTLRHAPCARVGDRLMRGGAVYIMPPLHIGLWRRFLNWIR